MLFQCVRNDVDDGFRRAEQFSQAERDVEAVGRQDFGQAGELLDG